MDQGVPAGATARRRDVGVQRLAAPAGARAAVRASWATIVVASSLPAIAYAELTGSVPAWLWAGQVAVATALLVASLLWRPLRRLWRFAIVLLALSILLQVTPLIHLAWPPLQNLWGGSSFDERMQPEQTAKFATSLAMIGLLLILGLRRGDFFLRMGELTAPIRPVRVLGFPHPDTWRRFGLTWGIGIAAVLFAVQYAVSRPSASDLMLIVPMIPSILFYAAVNALNEELTYRAPLLATLEPAVGSTHALWQTAVLFGVAHYFGTPGGLVGAFLSIFMGWILSKAMVETRGLFWPWFIHFLSDVSIFVFLALALVR